MMYVCAFVYCHLLPSAMAFLLFYPLTDKRLLLRDVPGMDAAVSLSGNTIERLV